MSASGLSGKRTDAMRAGIRTTNFVTLGTSVGRLLKCLDFIVRECASFDFQHDRDTVSDGVGQASALGDQFLARFIEAQGALRDGANQHVK